MKKNISLLTTALILLLALTNCWQPVKDPVSLQPLDPLVSSEREDLENSENSLIESQTGLPEPFELESLATNAIDDKKKDNVSKANAYCAYESVSHSDLLYVERKDWYRTEMYFGVNPDHFVVDLNDVSPFEIIRLAEEEFPQKKIYYYCLFKSPSEAAFEKLSDVLSYTVPITEIEGSTLKYQSPLYLTKYDIELIKEKDIGNLLMDFAKS